ncbi:K(+)-transporting ATPase subunit F [Nocardiopsis gilva YIM 90087]|uniref:K(+)-transporting ATPase subunit F n=1 Tax=Nocardiopsis gilva YIM 90087 TaxID=1235441 RepID=A0A223SB06_9ACTN|nr:K(+)-transporting ATPase subunit F [Nocardiopsis gilva]ASU85354.1 K(+)-transporting ATPase subunit F [Nocardiopsis gilva YIM 90087]
MTTSVLEIVGLAIAAALMVYLVVALVKAERF